MLLIGSPRWLPLWGRGPWKADRGSSRGVQTLPLLIAVEVVRVCEFLKTHQGKLARLVCFILCELHHCLERKREEDTREKE